LLAHIRKFLIELGAGFAFVGQQVQLTVDGEAFFIDLLFYHLKLRCYVVVDLKVKPFKPEFTGKMNFYLSAVDDLLRHSDDLPSIGLILCKTRSRIVAEYALRNLATPMGVARYTTRLAEPLPSEFQDVLPSPQAIEAELESGQPQRPFGSRLKQRCEGEVRRKGRHQRSRMSESSSRRGPAGIRRKGTSRGAVGGR
jgi:YhcG PDDEXK nuclease domain